MDHPRAKESPPRQWRRPAGPSPRSHCQSSRSVDRGQAAGINVPLHVASRARCAGLLHLDKAPAGQRIPRNAVTVPVAFYYATHYGACGAAHELRGHELLGGSVPRGRRRMVEPPDHPGRVPGRATVRRLPSAARDLAQHPQPASDAVGRRRPSSSVCPTRTTRRGRSIGSRRRAATCGTSSPRCGSGAIGGPPPTARR